VFHQKIEITDDFHKQAVMVAVNSLCRKDEVSVFLVHISYCLLS